MMSEEISREIILDVLESMLSSGLRAVRETKRAAGASPLRSRGPRKKSNIKLVEDILKSANEPLHVDDIIARAEADFGVHLRRESIVSALTKKVLEGRIFRRTGRNVFALLETEGR
ncbi:MAG: hypothetical protein ACOX6W_00045 [Lentisphaeria bacterium]|jgi:hypothetical protein